MGYVSTSRRKSSKQTLSDRNVDINSSGSRSRDQEDILDDQDFLNAASWELVEKPTYHGYVEALISLATMTLIVAYFVALAPSWRSTPFSEPSISRPSSRSARLNPAGEPPCTAC